MYFYIYKVVFITKNEVEVKVKAADAEVNEEEKKKSQQQQQVQLFFTRLQLLLSQSSHSIFSVLFFLSSLRMFLKIYNTQTINSQVNF